MKTIKKRKTTLNSRQRRRFQYSEEEWGCGCARRRLAAFVASIRESTSYNYDKS